MGHDVPPRIVTACASATVSIIDMSGDLGDKGERGPLDLEANVNVEGVAIRLNDIGGNLQC